MTICHATSAPRTLSQGKGTAAAHPPFPLRRVVRAVVLVAGAIAAFFVLRGKVPTGAELVATVRSAEPLWLVVAALAQAASMVLFAEQQRRLLHGFGVRISLRRLTALSLSRSAISLSMPAGSAVSAGYAYHQFRARGASKATATMVLLLAGVVSAAGLSTLFLGQLLLLNFTNLVSWTTHHGGFVVIAVVGVPSVWVLSRKFRDRLAGFSGATRWLIRHPRIREPWQAARRLPPRAWASSLGAASANWLTDLITLYAAVFAAHLAIGFGPLAGIYLITQLVRQIPITPGGLGVIEASLLTGLAALGAASAPAAAAVLGYRLMSAWLILPVGGAAWALLRRADRRSAGTGEADLVVQRNPARDVDRVRTTPALR